MKHKIRILATTCAIMGVATTSALAAPVLLDFEGFAVGQVIDNEYASLGVTISTNSTDNNNNFSVIFYSRQLDAGEDDADLVGPFDDENTPGHDNHDPEHILIISDDDARITCDGISCTPADDAERGGSITFDFDSGFDISMTSIDIFDINNGERAAEAIFYNNAGLVITTIILGNTGADNTFRSIDLTGIIGVRQMVVNLYGSGAIDNLLFDAIPNPIPGAIPLMLTGLVAGGISLRRKKKAA